MTGTIGLKLFKGTVRVVTRESPNAVYDAQLATFAESGGLFSQQASPGFIELWSLQSRMARRLREGSRSRVGFRACSTSCSACAVWKGGKWFLRRKYGSAMAPKPLLAGGLAAGRSPASLVAALKRGGDD